MRSDGCVWSSITLFIVVQITLTSSTREPVRGLSLAEAAASATRKSQKTAVKGTAEDKRIYESVSVSKKGLGDAAPSLEEMRLILTFCNRRLKFGCVPPHQLTLHRPLAAALPHEMDVEHTERHCRVPGEGSLVEFELSAFREGCYYWQQPTQAF